MLACRTFRADVDPVVEAAFEEALGALASAGLLVERVPAPSDASVGLDWFTISSAELAQSLEDVRDRWDSFEPSLQFQLEFGAAVTASQYVAAQRRRFEVAARFDDLLGTDGVLVVPTANAQSWPAEGPLPTAAGRVTDDPSIAVNTPDVNVTGHPAVSVPLGLDDAGCRSACRWWHPASSTGSPSGWLRCSSVSGRGRPWRRATSPTLTSRLLT